MWATRTLPKTERGLSIKKPSDWAHLGSRWVGPGQTRPTRSLLETIIMFLCFCHCVDGKRVCITNEQSRQRVLFQCLSFVLSRNAAAASHCLFLPSVGSVSASRICGQAAATRLHVHSYAITGRPGHGATGAKWNRPQPCHAQR